MGDSDAHLRKTAKKLQETLKSFGVNVTITNVSCGPTVTRYELQPEQGVKVSKIVGLTDDIKLNLAASDIRIEATNSGKGGRWELRFPTITTAPLCSEIYFSLRHFKRANLNCLLQLEKILPGSRWLPILRKCLIC